MTSALDVLHSLRIEDGRRWGQAAYAFQREDAEAILRGEPPFHFLTHARGSSKTGDQAGIVLSLLLTVGARERIYWLAADQEQGQLCIELDPRVRGPHAEAAALVQRLYGHPSDRPARERIKRAVRGRAAEVVPLAEASRRQTWSQWLTLAVGVRLA